MTIRSYADFFAGLLFLGIGLIFLVAGSNYDLGTPLRMGPGFFPLVLAGALIIIGIVTGLRAFISPGEPIGQMAVRGLALVTLSAVLFGFLIERAGLLIAVAVITIVSAFASERFVLGRTLIMAAVLASFCAIIFVYALGLQIPIIGPWFGAQD